MKTEISTFRLRAFSCPGCKIKHEIFGNEEPPKVCPICESQLLEKPDFDQVIKTKKTVEPYTGGQ